MKQKKGLVSSFIILGAFSLHLMTGCSNSSAGSFVSTTDTSSGGGYLPQDTGTLQSIANISFSNGSSSLSFSNNSSSSGKNDYILLLNSAGASSTDSKVILARNESTALKISAENSDLSTLTTDSELNPEEAFHLRLRYAEEKLALLGKPTQASNLETLELVKKDLSLGDTAPFRVLSSLSNLNSYEVVKGMLMAKTSDVYVYVDSRVANDVDTKAIQEMADNFTNNSLPRIRKLFGKESDINNDGHMTIIMSCPTNTMATNKGFVTGFFNPADMFQVSEYNPVSNNQEIFFTIVPDPNGVCGGLNLTNDFVLKILTGVFPHEYQHLVSFYRHVFEQGTSPEEPWLNECMSHFIEDYTGYNDENYARFKIFLDDPSAVSLTPSYSPGLAERGACYSFIRYLYEQNGDGDTFISKLMTSGKLGITNVVDAYAGVNPDFDDFEEFVRDWSTTLALSETGITSDPHYNYQAREIDPVTGNSTGLCVRCNTAGNRGTILDGPSMTTITNFPASLSIKSNATQFLYLKEPSGSVILQGSSSTGLQGKLISLSMD